CGPDLEPVGQARTAQRAAGTVAPSALDPDLLHQPRAEHAAEHRFGDRERRGVGVAVAHGEVTDPDLGLRAVRLVDDDHAAAALAGFADMLDVVRRPLA